MDDFCKSQYRSDAATKDFNEEMIKKVPNIEKVMGVTFVKNCNSRT